MENKCDCKNFENTFNINFDFFYKTYNKFISSKNDITNKSFKKLEESHEILQELLKDLKPKAEECISNMKSCSNTHSQNIEDISLKLDKFNDFEQKINNKYVEILKEIPKNDLEEEFKSDINKELSQNEIMEKDKKNIILMMNILKDEKYRRKKNEDMKDIIKLENELSGMVKNIDIELNKADEQIDNIENNVCEGFELVDKGELEAQIAAHTAVDRRKLQYQLGLPTLFCAIGTIVPGVGNIVGAVVGGLTAYGLHQIDKYRLQQIENEN